MSSFIYINSPRIQLLVLGFSIFISMLGISSVSPFLSFMARDFGSSGIVLGLIYSSFSASRAIMIPYVGGWSDKFGRKRFLIIGMAGTAILGLMLIWTSTPLEMIINRIFQGIFAAMVLPVSMAIVADIAPQGTEGRHFGLFSTFLLLGFGIGPLIGGVLFDIFGLIANFLTMGVLSIISLLLIVCFIKESSSNKYRYKSGGWKLQIKLLKDKNLSKIFLARIATSMSMGCYIIFLPLFSAEIGLSKVQSGILLAAKVLFMIILQRPAGKLADQYSRLVLTSVGLFISALGKVLIPISKEFWKIMIINFLESFGAGLSLPPLTALIVDRGRRLDVGMGAIMGLFAMALSVGVFIGPLLGGWLIDLGSTTTWSFYFSGFVELIGVGFLLKLRSC